MLFSKIWEDGGITLDNTMFRMISAKNNVEQQLILPLLFNKQLDIRKFNAPSSNIWRMHDPGDFVDEDHPFFKQALGQLREVRDPDEPIHGFDLLWRRCFWFFSQIRRQTRRTRYWLWRTQEEVNDELRGTTKLIFGRRNKKSRLKRISGKTRRRTRMKNAFLVIETIHVGWAKQLR